MYPTGQVMPRNFNFVIFVRLNSSFRPLCNGAVALPGTFTETFPDTTYLCSTPGTAGTANPRLDPSNSSISSESGCWTWPPNIVLPCSSKSSSPSVYPRTPLRKSKQTRRARVRLFSHDPFLRRKPIEPKLNADLTLSVFFQLDRKHCRMPYTHTQTYLLWNSGFCKRLRFYLKLLAVL